ncbi:hypothetical protein HTZ97_10445 [Desulfuromonas acetoxidans]|uniref:Uncharacterized protein n=1 Tax=Desulfuromonas acetoxidans (strain DSM 684 / 11070) TaxID=281689 RepID=Q1JZY3_DESA6|nr:hypothetical protein [Desulfuromonas acetoxidans]EAT15759.1 hypothetical protein Dace_2459 [Desulfuromonas acetoxidans DSM 684]MBF0646036.1 hypothetical protein [Desulfuromonas acetoxidans]NVD25853.1 hypothetical protein [Desulfuromonas acetoxidans]NVE16885.1 hypothetical protein [Desulfuromonas acetoxidans]
MNTINTAFNKSANLEALTLDSKAFDRIDSKVEAGREDTVHFSSEAQFKLNLQTYAFGLSDTERGKFVDALEQSDEAFFDENFLQWLRNPPNSETFRLTVDPELEARINDVGPITGGVASDSEIIIQYSGSTLIGEWSFHEALSSSGDIHETDHLTEKLDQLTTKASEELSGQDQATITGAMDSAIRSSRNYLNSSFSLFKANYDYEVAAQAIAKLPMSDGLKEEYSNFLSEIRAFQEQLMTDHIDQQERKIQRFPQFSEAIGEEIQALEEGLEINAKLQQSISNSENGLLGAEDYFQGLIENAEYIKRDSSEQISEMFNHYAENLGEFNRIYIEKDWGLSSSQQAKSDPALDLVFQETQELTNHYISAINAYMANTGSA